MTTYTRGGLANALGCNGETVRYYEKIALLPLPERASNGYRIYDEAAHKRLGFILRLRELGFSIKEIRSLLGLVDSGLYSCSEIHALTQKHIETVQEKIKDLQKLNSTLVKISLECKKGETPDCPILDALGAV